MTRKLTLLLVFLAASISAFANIGFCPPPATETACSNGAGLDGETIPVAGDTFGMWWLGHPGQTTDSPWYLLVSIPSDGTSTPTAPTITSDPAATFTIGAGVDVGTPFLPTTDGSIYDFASALDGGGGGNGSMSAANMFGVDEQAAFNGTPASFEVFVYSITPGVGGSTPYTFLSSPGLVAGTFLAALGGSPDASTPFTTTGLVGGPSTTTGPGTTGGPGGGPASGPLVPEPSSIALLGSALVAVTIGLRKKLIRS